MDKLPESDTPDAVSYEYARVARELSTYLDELAHGSTARKPCVDGAPADMRRVVKKAEWLGDLMDDERAQARDLAKGRPSTVYDAISDNPLTESFGDIRSNLTALYAMANDAVAGDFDNISVEGKNEFLTRMGNALDILREQRRNLERSAYSDALTELGNRAAFNRDMDRLWELECPHAMAFIDIDGLKYCNDNFGHFEGNRYILEVADHLRLHKKASESLYRLGGDEFVLLSIDASEEELGERLEACRDSLQDNHAVDEVFSYSFSFGCAYADPKSGDTRTQLMVDADKRMYSYKLLHASNVRHTSPLPPIDDHQGIQDKIFQAMAETAEGRYLFICDIDSDMSRWSRNAVRDFGLPAEAMRHMGEVWAAHVHPEDRDAWRAEIGEVFAGTKHRHAMSYRAKDASGRYVMVTCTGVRIDAADDAPALFVGTIINRNVSDGTDPATGLDDVRALAQAIDERRVAHACASFVAVRVGGIAEINSTHGYEAGNGALMQLADRMLSRMGEGGKLYRSYGLQFVAMLDDCDEGSVERLAGAFREALAAPVHVQGLGIALPVALATLRCDSVSAQPLSILSQINRLVDARVRAIAEARPEHRSFMCLAENSVTCANTTDSLTGLPRASEFLRQATERSHSDPMRRYCIACIDLGQMRIFNEWYGRAKGDALLAEVGRALGSACARIGGCAGYWGQDDFTAFIPNSADAVDSLYDRIEEIVASHDDSIGFLPAVGVCPLEYGADVGIADYDKAKFTLDQARSSFKERVRYFKPQDYRQSEEDHLLLAEFQHALSSRRVFFQVQPQCDIVTGRIVGVEALARWRRADGSYLSPAVFVPLLERSGFVALLDRHIWDQVFAWIASCLERGMNVVPVSINVSQIDIISFDVAECLDRLVDRYRVPSHLVKVEITESAYAGDDEIVQRLTNRLKALGFTVFMDDFGSGQSSLSMLKNIVVDVVKLDGNFMRPGNAKNAIGGNIVESVVDLVHSIDLPIVVEGVETERQVEFLKGLGCRYVQGFYYYRPMVTADFEDILGNASKIDTRGILRPSALERADSAAGQRQSEE